MSRASPDTPSQPTASSHLASNGPGPDADSNAEAVFYPVKWVLDAAGASLPICMQARNGPCALLALANVNLQNRAFTLQPGTTRVREDHLMAILADFVSTSASSDTLRAHAVADFIDLLPRLNRGMHVNVRFSAPTAFEFTRELSVFDVFPRLRLVHGWLVDPQDTRLAEALGTLTYNQVIDELVRTATPPPPPPPEQQHPPSSLDALRNIPSAPPLEAFAAPDPSAPPLPDANELPDPNELQHLHTSPESLAPLTPPSDSAAHIQPDLPEETSHTSAIREIRPFVMDFLESNPTQLTVYGLTELHSALQESETAVLFRNSHFYVIHKHGGELYTLVTDVGYLNELNTVWEKLCDVNGDSTFYNGSFHRIGESGSVHMPTGPQPPAGSVHMAPGPQAPAPKPSVPQARGVPGASSRQSGGQRRSAGVNHGSRTTPGGTTSISGRKSSEKCVIQ